ncbi:MAG: OmpH family outer membrane protein [Candidatus Omnitrophota bacterium]|nr:OmpH family outer membrane protein [Candidatus Omnitrophota bacterium]
MKKICVLALLLMFLVGSAYAADKFAYVDLTLIFSEYYKTKDYEKILEAKQKQYDSEREKRVSEVKQLQDKLDLLSEKEKEAKKGDFETKLRDLQEYDRQNIENLRKEEFDRQKEILKDIEDAVRQYSEKEGYTMVFNDRVLVYQTKNLDITEKIVEILNKEKKK